MPRELIHWVVLDSCLKRFSERGIILFPDDDRSVCLLGALAHDSPYYHRLGTGDFSTVGEYLHGHKDADTLDPIRKLNLSYQSDRSSLKKALIIGMLSHMATDIEFHPLVFYFTGDYYHPDPTERYNARSRHRLIEVFLDSWMARNGGSVYLSMTIKSLLKDVGPKLDMMCQELSKMSCETKYNPDNQYASWKESFGTMASLQNSFVSPIQGPLIRFLGKFSIWRFKDMDPLITFGRSDVPHFLAGEIDYKNPVSGDLQRYTLEALLKRSIDRCEKYFKAFLSNNLEAIKAESLNYGILGAAPNSAKYFEPGFVSISPLV